MSGLFGSLSNSVQSLAAQSAAVETVGRNIANVNNPNYARQRVIAGDVGMRATPDGAQSLGMGNLTTVQLRDALLDRQVTREVARSADYTSLQTAYERAETSLGQTISLNQVDSVAQAGTSAGIGGSITDFFNSFESLAATPTAAGSKQEVLLRADVLVDEFHTVDRNLDQLQSDLTDQATKDLSDAQGLLKDIASLNAEIGRLEYGAPGSATDLRDLRQSKLEELAGKMAFETRSTDGMAGQLDIVVKDSSGADVSLVSGPNSLDNLTLSGSSVTIGDPAVALQITGGSVKGTLDARDGGIQTLRDRLDTLAGQLVKSVNAAYNPTGATGDFFVSTGTTAASISLDPSLTVNTLKTTDGAAVGDNTLARAVADVISQTHSVASGDSIDGTLTEYYGNLVSELGQAVSSASDQADSQASIQQLVTNQRDSVSGVSMDEELADLMKYQRSYQASSRVIQVIDELLNTVVNGLHA